MNAKLTLKLNKEDIDSAKVYAGVRQTSLSALVEKYFVFLSGTQKKAKVQLSPIVGELSGIIKLPEDFDLKEEYADYLIEKYK